MVDRYSSECTELCHFPNDNGDWVYYADYRALEAKLAALVEAANDFFNPKTRVEDDMLEAFRQQKAKAEKVRAARAAMKAGGSHERPLRKGRPSCDRRLGEER